MSRGDMREAHELRRVIASGARWGLPGGAKQSPSQVRDCFVANCAPRNDRWKFMSSGSAPSLPLRREISEESVTGVQSLS
jgi:hypothetical protein